MASSFSSPRNWVYDVFPSFRGEDVRGTFLSHFFNELDRKLIKSFKENEIERSHSLDPELKLAIRTSRIVVVLLSQNYASSSWCLNELLEIMKCKEEIGQMVIPVFDRLDPSHVRKQTGKFGDAFAKTCQNQTEAEKQLWQQALTDLANLHGYHSQNWDSEAKMIEEIANEVLKKLLVTTSKEYEEFVGLENHIAEMSVLLDLESEEVKMVGIWGSSGIGKTTIARALYSRISHWFQGSVYIDKAFIYKSMKIYNGSNPDDYNMKLHLQRILLSKILDKKEIQIDRLGAVEERLKHQQVLIFIDDLNDQVVLDALVGQLYWFGSGSRVIVITKDKHFLRAHGIDHIYEVCLPSEELALEMFCRSAFRQNSPPDGLKELVSEVAMRAGNLPLGLNVLGSYLRGRDTKDWVDMLPSLRSILSGQIEKTLRVSYDGLNNKKDKAIFRHIACLFNGAKIKDIECLLAHSGLDINIGLKNLVDKSLIHVNQDIVKMHSLLQEMGKEIVNGQSSEPGEREFIVDSMDICDVLNDNTGTKKVLGISLDISEATDLCIHEKAFKRMRNLRFLKFYTKKWNMKNDIRWNLPKGFSYFPTKLRFLRLDEYPRRCMPLNFRPENLVKLQMRDSKLEKLWQGVKSLTGLKKMDLRRSRNLKEIPNLSLAINLEKLHLSDCSSLVELPSSIKNLNKLKELNMLFCKNLKTLPTGINLQSLCRLNCFSCSSLKTFPAISTNISFLHIGETAIEEFPTNLHLKNLVSLCMFSMESGKLWESIQSLTPIMTMISPSLTKLWLSDIPSLVELPSSFQYLNNLNDLRITRCINLETLPTGINLKSLYQLNLSGCLRLKRFPNISTNISYLNLSQTGIEEVPSWIENFSYLMVLGMDGCKNLKCVSQHIYKLKHLEEVDFSNCGALTTFRWNDSPIEVTTDNIQSKLPIPEEVSSSLPDEFSPKVGYTLICFNLDPESLLRQRSVIFKSMMLPGEEVPSYFTHRTTGSSTILTIPLLHSSLLQPFLRFRVCAVVSFDSVSRLAGNGVRIHVNCRFKGRLWNNFESFGQSHMFWTHKKDNYLFVLDCLIPLNKDNAALAQLNYDHVDIQLHMTKISDSNFKLKGWGIRLSEDFSSRENRLGNPNTIPYGFEANVDTLVSETEHSEEDGDRYEETERSRKRIRIETFEFPCLQTQEEHMVSL